MIEIEAKFKLADGVVRSTVLEKIQKHLTEPLAEKHQIDTVFLLPEQVDKSIVTGSQIMRVRDVLDPKTGELTKSLMTLKVHSANTLASQEYEFAVSDGTVARRMLEVMGWQNVVTVDKLRAESKIANYGVCIDEVAKLGLFIELEVLAEGDAQVDVIQAQMKEFLHSLGLEGEIWNIPYDTSIMNLKESAK
jgi:adenylate cyclase class 2